MFIEVKDALLYATRHGPREAPAILGIGGWIGSGELWAEPFAMLDEHWATIAYDHRGSGVTVAQSSAISLDALVADVFAVQDAYGVARCALAAESAGAMTAIAAALARPERVSRLILVDGLYHRDVSDAEDRFLRGLQTAYSATLDRFVELCVPEPDCGHIKRWGRHIIDRAEPEAAIALRRLGGDIDLRPRLGEIRVPTLVLHGSRDAIVPLASAQALAGAIGGAELQVLDGAGHVPTLTRPAQVAQAMAEFLRRHPSP